MIRINSILLAALTVAGCASQAAEDEVLDADGKADSSRTAIPLTVGACADAVNDGYELANVQLTGNRLLVDASYGGGCAQHTFKACWDGSFLESLPVQAQLRLYHDGHGDLCEALKSTPLSIDLTALGTAYKSAYQVTSGKVVVRLGDFADTYDVKTLTASKLKTAFATAARGASYMSESDSEPTWLSAAATGQITGELVLAKFRSKLELEGNVAFEIERGQVVKDTLASWAEYAEGDDDYIVESAQAFGRIKALLEGNLTDLTFVRIGPASDDGTLATDAGAYNLVIVGKTVDGKVAGFFVISVET